MSSSDETKAETPASKPGRAPAVTVQSTPVSKRLDYRIPASSAWAGRWKLSLGAGVLGAIASVIAWRSDPTRFAFAYLFAFFVVMTITFGSFFFIIIERLTGAGWSVSSRRVAEFFAGSSWVLAAAHHPRCPVGHHALPVVERQPRGSAGRGRGRSGLVPAPASTCRSRRTPSPRAPRLRPTSTAAT